MNRERCSRNLLTHYLRYCSRNCQEELRKTLKISVRVAGYERRPSINQTGVLVTLRRLFINCLFLYVMKLVELFKLRKHGMK
jgi:hypothetical protein